MGNTPTKECKYDEKKIREKYVEFMNSFHSHILSTKKSYNQAISVGEKPDVVLIFDSSGYSGPIVNLITRAENKNKQFEAEFKEHKDGNNPRALKKAIAKYLLSLLVVYNTLLKTGKKMGCKNPGEILKPIPSLRLTKISILSKFPELSQNSQVGQVGQGRPRKVGRPKTVSKPVGRPRKVGRPKTVFKPVGRPRNPGRPKCS